MTMLEWIGWLLLRIWHVVRGHPTVTLLETHGNDPVTGAWVRYVVRCETCGAGVSDRTLLKDRPWE